MKVARTPARTGPSGHRETGLRTNQPSASALVACFSVWSKSAGALSRLPQGRRVQQPGPRPAGRCARSLPPLAGLRPDPDSPQLPSPKKTALHAVVAVFSRQVVSAPFLTPGTAAGQAPLSIAFLRQEHWSGCRIFLQGIFQTQGPSPHLLPRRHLGSHAHVSSQKRPRGS